MSRTPLFRSLLRLSIALFIIGIMFLIQHWPFGFEIRIVGLIGIGVSSYLHYSSKTTRLFIHELARVLVPLLCAYVLVSQFSFSFHAEIEVALLSFAAIYAILIGLKLYNQDKLNGIHKANWERILYILGVIMICTGLILKNQFSPYTGICFMLGVVVMIIAYMVGILSKNEVEQAK